MSQRGGDSAAKRAKSSDDDVGDAAGEDLLSALPDDIIVLILLRLDTAAAVRTSALSRRWRRVWVLLPELRFHLAPDGPRIREVLDAPEAPELRCLSVTTEGAGPDSAAAWLPVAARRLAGGLVYHNMVPGNDDDDDEEAVGRGELQLPCFKKATTIELNMGFLGLALPSPGVFARLTELSLRCVRFRGPCVLGEVVSSPRCPFLKKLEVRDSRGLHNLSIHSESLLQMKLKNLHRFRQLIIVSPILQELSVDNCFLDDDPSELVANISAPQLVTLEWKDVYDPRYVHLGNLGQLQWLATRYFCVYGGGHAHRDKNRHCLRLLQQFHALHTLKLTLLYLQDIGDFQYLMGDITMLPQISHLQLVVWNEGLAHAFGASTFHLLRMYAGLRSLLFFLAAGSNLESTCPSGCICDQPMIWKTEGLVLNHLEYAFMYCLQGSGHEVIFAKQLLNWAPTLKSMRITFNHQISESKAREFCQALAGFSRPETYVKFYKFGDASKSSSIPLLAPEGQDTEL